MRRRLSLLALVALLALTALVPAARAVDRAGLRSTLTTLHNRLGPAAGAYVVDLTTGDVLFSHRDSLALAPASNEKLFATAAALLRFGASGTLPTTLQAAPGTEIDADGVLRGDLYLVGGGDPTLGDAGLQALADQLVTRGVVRIDGGVIGDESLFDTLRGGPDSAYRPDGDLGGWLTALSWRHGRAGAAGPREGRRDQARRAAQGPQGHLRAQAARREAQRGRAGAASPRPTPSPWPRSPRRRSPP